MKASRFAGSSEQFIHPPFDDAQVAALNAWQANPWVHPFTCGHCRDTLGIYFMRNHDGSLRPETEEDFAAVLTASTQPLLTVAGRRLLDSVVVLDRTLVATESGWVCPTCPYTQDWAHAYMANDRMARPAP